jgi:hypothetical protein
MKNNLFVMEKDQKTEDPIEECPYKSDCEMYSRLSCTDLDILQCGIYQTRNEEESITSKS